jgi:hypothetical protein
MAVDSDRRSYPRAEIRWPVTVKTTRGFIEAKLRNLGVGGAYIHCDETANLGEIVTLTIKPPDSPVLSITAEVIWTGKVLALGMGVRFVEISDKDRQYIYDTVSELIEEIEVHGS